MVEISLQKALELGVEAHKKGNHQVAEAYYSAILKKQPKHPDASHNMGILAIGLGNVSEAIPFFKIALEANSGVVQYWRSYIKALMQLEDFAQVKSAIQLAGEKGVDSDWLHKISKGLNKKASSLSSSETHNQKIESKSKTVGANEKVLNQKLAVQDPPESLVTPIVNLYNQSQYETAIQHAKKLLIKFPYAAGLYNIIGAANQCLGKLSQAVASYDYALSINPAYADAYINKGNAHRAQGNFDDAMKSYEKAASLNPNHPDTYNNMGILLKDQGKLLEALEAYKKAIAIKPDFAQVYNNIGVIFQKQGKLSDAINAFNEAIKLQSNFAEAYNNIGIARKDQEKFNEAILAYKTAIQLKPNFAEAYNNLGNIFHQLGQMSDALATFDTATALTPNNPAAHNNRGIALIKVFKLDEALLAFKTAIKLDPKNVIAYCNMAIVLDKQGSPFEALMAFETAIRLDPNNATAHCNMARIFTSIGDIEKAKIAYKTALEIQPDFAEAHRQLSQIETHQTGSPRLTEVENLLKTEYLSKKNKCNLHFAAAKMYEDINYLDEAFEHLLAGNAIRKELLNYSIDIDKNQFDIFRKTQANLDMNSLDICQNLKGLTPIFILGMPRSGTTLVEQIISAHTKVMAGGELELVFDLGADLITGERALNIQNLHDFRVQYLDKLELLSHGKPFVTDKMPHNFRFIPLLCTALPEAKIIHVSRDPAAVCWSNFKHYFSIDGLGYCYDLRDLIAYYKLYSDLMQVWRINFSDRIFELSYEKLTMNTQRETKRLLDFIGLGWEEGCLSPHKNTGSVHTASNTQVKKEIYQGSSQEWRKYEPFLNGIFDYM